VKMPQRTAWNMFIRETIRVCGFTLECCETDRSNN